eukprot:TRINITY_DN10256_c0_g1_i5.p1 TRINITY_DN10256_c0_g1~~TRINITY_DN10256_c0_g1_i5.p1  ORF type:complete len:416 (-),score=50.04 TRINITY_DN10256_c0_g1_i5:365-1612(-)
MAEDPPSYDAVLQASQVNISEIAQSSPTDTTVTVTDPSLQRGASGGQYTSYKVTTRSTNPKFKCCNAHESIVMRRFSEFHALYGKLRQLYPGVVVPPCPEKNQVENMRKSPAFIEARRQALEVFINKVCSHRVLKHSDILQKFLEANETEWHIEMSKIKGEDSLMGHLRERMTDALHSTMNLAKMQPDDKGEDHEYLQYKEYATHLDHHLKDACGRAADFVSKQTAYADALATFGQQAENLSKYEDGPAASAFVDMHQTASGVAKIHKDATTHINRIFAAPVKEQHLAMKSLKETMQDRSTALLHRQQADQNVKACKTRIQTLRANGKPEAILSAEAKLSEAEEAARLANEEYQRIVDTMREELAVFQNEKSNEMTASLRDFALAQAKLAKQSAAKWRELSQRMQPAVDSMATQV